MITLSNGMHLTDEDVAKIQEAVAIRSTPKSKRISMEEAAVILRLKRSTARSLSAAFSRLSSPKIFKHPLRSYRVGKVREFEEQDVINFRDNISKVRH